MDYSSFTPFRFTCHTAHAWRSTAHVYDGIRISPKLALNARVADEQQRHAAVAIRLSFNDHRSRSAGILCYEVSQGQHMQRPGMLVGNLMAASVNASQNLQSTRRVNTITSRVGWFTSILFDWFSTLHVDKFTVSLSPTRKNPKTVSGSG